MTSEDIESNTKLEDKTIVEDEDEISDVENYKEDYRLSIIEDSSNFDSPEAESTNIDKQIDADKIEQIEENESTEVDRMLMLKKQSKKMLKKQRKKISQKIRNPCFCDLAVDAAKVVTKGKWVNVSD